MNNYDERDFEEERANRKILETGDGEIDDGPRHWITHDSPARDAAEESGLAGRASLDRAMGELPRPETILDKRVPFEYLDKPPRDLFREGLLRNGGINLGRQPYTMPSAPGLTDYYFTFGLSAKLVAYNKDLAFNPDQQGISLAPFYVRIDAANEDAARAEMTRRWADCWAFCYQRDAFLPRIAKGNYTELK